MKTITQNLSRFQKVILLLMAAMALIFAADYAVTTSRVGLEYNGAILVPGPENGRTMYSGRISGRQAVFTVSEDKTVTFQYDDKTYGPYTAKEDPDAVPAEEQMVQQMTGLVLYQGETVLFRGGVLDVGDSYWLFNADGSLYHFSSGYRTSDGAQWDENGNVIDSAEPSAATILKLMNDPALTHKGAWPAWFMGMFICILNAFSILFADKLFRWNLAFQIRDADQAEPSDWAIMCRHISWVALAITALIIFIMGLQ